MILQTQTQHQILHGNDDVAESKTNKNKRMMLIMLKSSKHSKIAVLRTKLDNFAMTRSLITDTNYYDEADSYFRDMKDFIAQQPTMHLKFQMIPKVWKIQN